MMGLMSHTTKDEAKLVTQTETGVLVYEKETFTLVVKRLLCKDVRGGGGGGGGRTHALGSPFLNSPTLTTN